MQCRSARHGAVLERALHPGKRAWPQMNAKNANFKRYLSCRVRMAYPASAVAAAWWVRDAYPTVSASTHRFRSHPLVDDRAYRLKPLMIAVHWRLLVDRLVSPTQAHGVPSFDFGGEHPCHHRLETLCHCRDNVRLTFGGWCASVNHPGQQPGSATKLAKGKASGYYAGFKSRCARSIRFFRTTNSMVHGFNQERPT
jgi:hypothetical protein